MFKHNKKNAIQGFRGLFSKLSSVIMYIRIKKSLHYMLYELTNLVRLLNIKKFYNNQVNFLKATRVFEMAGEAVFLVFTFVCIYFFSVLLCCLSDNCYNFYMGGL